MKIDEYLFRITADYPEDDYDIDVSIETVDENFDIVVGLIIEPEYMRQISIPVHQFFSMVKSMTLNYGKGYCISSFQDFGGTWFANISGRVDKRTEHGNSEPEAILNAWKWIENNENPKGLK